jgi:hypothetical protein
MNRTNEEILDHYAEVFSHLKDIFNEDMMVLITNRTHRLHFFPGEKLVLDMIQTYSG